MDCKALSALILLLLIAFLLFTSGSVTPCQEFNCGLNKTFHLDDLSDDGSFSCIEWNGTAIDEDEYDEDDVPKCLLFIKTKRNNGGIINFVLSDSNIDGQLIIGHGEDPENSSTILHTVTNSTGWGENGIIYEYESIWIAWSTTVDGKIKAQFQDLIFKQFPVTLHKEENGTFGFPNVSCDYTYRPNSAFIWLLSTDDYCNKTCNETTMDITMKEVSVIESGDALILGMGNKTQMLQGPKSLLLPGNLTEPLNIHLTLGEAFVILLTGRSVTESAINFKINWKRTSTKPKNATVLSTTAMPEAWLESVSVCINGSKEEFGENVTAFKETVAEIATRFARNEGIVLPYHKIRHEVVEIIDTLGNNGSKILQIILTIVEQHDKTKPVFRSEQVQEMFSKEVYRKDLRKAGFKITSCLTNPDYVDWFWASCVSFIFSIAILLVVWYIRSKNFFEKEDSASVENLIHVKKDNLKQKTVGNEYEQSYYTRESLQNIAKDRANENSVAEINTEHNAVTHAKAKVEKHHSDVGARRNLAKSNHIQVRPTSDPIRLQEIKKQSPGIESPKSILRKGVKFDELDSVPITEEPQENVQEHLYDTVGSQKVLIISEAGNSVPEHYVNAVSIEDEIEDTRC